MRPAFLLALVFALLAPQLFAERWSLQYFYDQDRTQLNLVDLAFPSPQRGIAVGSIVTTASDKKPKPTSLVTSDGGEHWTLLPLKDEPRSLFFLNDSLGWMVTENGLWITEESGRSWRKVSDQKRPNSRLGPPPPGGLIMRVWFLDAQHGFAVGYQKTVLETHDGGHTWMPIQEAAKPTGNPAFTAYTQIGFVGRNGFIVGAATPPRRDLGPYPAWMDPARATKQKQQPNLELILQTHDGGATWNSSMAPVLGLVVSLRLAGTQGLNVFGFPDSAEYPSEVYRIDLAAGTSSRVFAEKNRRVTDAAIFASSATGADSKTPRGFLAAVEPPGRLNSLPIPGKVKMLSTANLTQWKEMEVDYRAVASNVILAGTDPEHLWAATDTGMVLKLVK